MWWDGACYRLASFGHGENLLLSFHIGHSSYGRYEKKKNLKIGQNVKSEKIEVPQDAVYIQDFNSLLSKLERKRIFNFNFLIKLNMQHTQNRPTLYLTRHFSSSTTFSSFLIPCQLYLNILIICRRFSSNIITFSPPSKICNKLLFQPKILH